ncbi:MAG: hypothetical protein IE909_13550 [Campylobacterales bacterium]|nr:hypothetical protein [Campylobacterota bacterium]MBD3842880.1 hypothetical protein [Campylobacterales bacterium]
MRLIATMGASGISQKHVYSVNNKEYQSELSFMALAEAYHITDIVVIGTEISKNKIQPILDQHSNIEMVVIESDQVEDVFQKSLEYIVQDTILDLTQGYRHYPMLTLLASIFLQNSKTKNVKDIFYAQIEDENCQAYQESCRYRFTSLIKYLDIANMARIINTFKNTLLTLDYDVQYSEFRVLRDSLDELTRELFSNNFKQSSKKAKKIETNINKILKDRDLDIVKEHLNNLKEEMQQIQALDSEYESERLLNVSEYFLQKRILLHSVTLLYEAMVAFLDERVNNYKCNTINRRGEEVPADIFQRRNCLKLNMGSCKQAYYQNNISQCKEFSSLLRKIDGLRNNSAHAHTTGTYQEDLKHELEKAIKFLIPIIKQNISTEEKVTNLQDMFNNR